MKIPIRVKASRIVWTAALLTALQRAAFGVDAITVGAVQVDPATRNCLGFVVPITQGDDNHNARVDVQYRVAGQSAWKDALPLLRIRPETISTETPPGDFGVPNPAESFAGSIIDLQPGTTYEVLLTVTDPDGGGATQTFTTATLTDPLTTPATPRAVAVATQTQLDAALAAAQAGDVIQLAAGTYTGVTITRSGTLTNPIIVRGASESGVVLNAAGRTYGIDIRASYAYVEQLTVDGSQWGARIQNSTGAVIRHVTFHHLQFGIDGMSANRNAYVCDNTLEGPHQWPDVSSATWDTEGIAITGQGHTVCHNRLSGFGDALGLHQASTPNVSIDFIENDVLFTGDDGMELDYGYRNIRAYRNRITNSGMGVSMQPVWGGPIYVIKNVFVNQAHAPYKLNNEPSGFLLLNNTSMRTQGDGNYGAQAWQQIGYQLPGHWSFAANFQFKNNIAVGVTGPVRFTTAVLLGEFDYDGWFPDGQFVLYDTYANLLDVKARSAYEAHGLVLNGLPFATDPSMPANYTTLVSPKDLSLSAATNAVDAATLLPNVNDDFAGSGPDLGALERGRPVPAYGPRTTAAPTQPNPPTQLTVQ
jgi:hypothetical protein